MQNFPNVRDEVLPQNSAKKSENIHKIQLGIRKKHRLSDNLREMPKSCWWVSSEPNKNGENFVCNLCGRRFRSARAVFGHMRSHSKRKAAAKVKDYAVKEEIIERSNTPRKKRSGRRYTIKTSSSNGSSWCNLNNSHSSVTVADEELLDIAASLLKLSKGGFCDHVSDNDNDDDSVKMEPRLPIDSVSNIDKDDDHVAERVCDVESGLNFDVMRAKCDSFQDEIKEFHGFNCGLPKSKRGNFEHGPVSDVEIQSELMYDAEIKDGAIGVLVNGILLDYSNPISFVPAVEETKSRTADVVDRMLNEWNSRTCDPTDENNIESGPIVHNELFDAEIKDESREVLLADTLVHSMSSDPVIEEKKQENVADKCKSGSSEPATDSCSKNYICSICNRSFPSHQSLGGHRLHCQRLCGLEIRAHMIRTDITVVEEQGGKNEMKFGDNEKKKRWKHKCVVCSKDFRTGQALGGHMRAHFNGKVESNETENLAAIKEKNDSNDNRVLPAVIEERKHDKDVCSNELLKERHIVISSQGNTPLLV
ncbi:hypothetical protein SOVF_152280 [Spinacia oleracea]|nr:hypothetical protein SOVF_152280 [Spinacia oleracea]